MLRLARFLNPKSAPHRVALHTALISVAIAAVVVPIDFIVNVGILHDVANYTPWATLVIVLLVSPPTTFALLWQMERVRKAQSMLAEEQAARAAAEAINIARSRFLANTSHELRTPLSGVIGYSELLLETAQQEGRGQDVSDLERVITSAKRLLHLVNDLLDLAKLDADRVEIAPAPFNVGDVLREAVEIATPAASRNRNRIALAVADNLPVAVTDAARLGQCVLNLLSNAAKFTSDGLITVRASCKRQADREWLIISVEDSGVGIAPEQQPLLFEPFMQTQAEGDRAREGSGLGLAITRKLARLMGGDVSCASERHKGSRFTIKVPMRYAQAGHAPDAAPEAQAADAA